MKTADSPTSEQRILAAAEAEFIRKGFAGARTTAIAEAAGVTHAMLHYYFGTKDKLFETILRNKIETLSQVLVGAIDISDKSLRENLEIIISNHFDFIAANPDLPRFLVTEVMREPERMKFLTGKIGEYAATVFADLQKQIDTTAARGECRPVDAGALVLTIMSLNIFPFMASPIVETVLGDRAQQLLEGRKQENIDTIMRKIGL